MNTNTSTEGNGKKELKVTKTNEADKLIDEYFGKYFDIAEPEEASVYYYTLSTHALSFETKDQSIRTQGGDDSKENQNFVSAINVLESGKRDFVLEEIAKGATANVRLADLKKVKVKVAKLKKEKEEKKNPSTEKDKQSKEER